MGYKKLLLISVGLGVLMIVLGPPFYIGLPLSGTVVEAATGRPIEGAVVVQMSRAYRHFGIESNPPAGLTSAQEAVTDAKGRFTIESWFSWGIWFGRIPSSQPQLTVLKAGYTPRRLNNDSPGHPTSTVAELFSFSKSVLRKSLWNSKTIALEVPTGNMEQQARALESATFDWGDAIGDSNGRCEIVEALKEHEHYVSNFAEASKAIPRSHEGGLAACVENNRRHGGPGSGKVS